MRLRYGAIKRWEHMDSNAIHIMSLEITGYLTHCANRLAVAGREFNEHLVRQFQSWDTEAESVMVKPNLPAEHVSFLKAVAFTLGWLEQSVAVSDVVDETNRTKLLYLPKLYLQCLLEQKAGVTGSIEARFDELLQEAQTGMPLRRPRRLTGVIAGLDTWAKVNLDVATSPNGSLDLETLQDLALKAGKRARWTALAPVKMGSLLRGSAPRSLFPPVGSAVSRGIERLLGFSLSESENDYTIARGLHLRLADLAQASVVDINSGLYRLGGGS